jgi:hypothetical protein
MTDEEESDQELLSEEEADPDAMTLIEVVNLLRPLLRDHVDLYSEMRRLLIQQQRARPVLSLQTEVLADVAPSDTPSTPGFDPTKIAEFLATFRSRLRQMQFEQKAASETNSETVSRLEAENDHLHAALLEARRGERSSSSPEESDATPQPTESGSPASAAPKSIIQPAYRSSRVSPATRDNKSESSSPGARQTPTRLTPSSPWSSKRVKFPPGSE